MIYEVAALPVRAGSSHRFRRAFTAVEPLLMRAKGYEGHVLLQGVESPDTFTLIVSWQSLADHSPGFEASFDHHVFMTELGPYLSDEPAVYHAASGATGGSGWKCV